MPAYHLSAQDPLAVPRDQHLVQRRSPECTAWPRLAFVRSEDRSLNLIHVLLEPIVRCRNFRDKCWPGMEESHVTRNATDIWVALKLARHLKYGAWRDDRVGVGAEDEFGALVLSNDCGDS